MTHLVSTISELEACVGAAGLPVKMKIIDHLDAEAAHWIAASPLAFVGVGGAAGPRLGIAGGPAGFARVDGDGLLVVPLEALDGPRDIAAGAGAGVLFLIPGVGETLRANGRVQSVAAGRLKIAVEECFVHCAKALIRSEFWQATASDPPDDVNAFVDASRFLALATMDREGKIDVSPKGDPAGLLIAMDGDRATLAERPGNRLAFGYRNIVEQAQVAVLCLIPGARTAVGFSGRAVLTRDEAVRGRFVVDGKVPILATVIEGVQPARADGAALVRANLWTGPPAPTDIDPAATLVAHVKLNKARGPEATMLRLSANRGLVAKGLEASYRHGLY